MAAKLSETKKFYTLYNTLTDSKTCYEKEVQLLDSIHDNYDKYVSFEDLGTEGFSNTADVSNPFSLWDFCRAMQSDSAKEQFLRQLDAILESLKQTVSKAEKKRSSERLKEIISTITMSNCSRRNGLITNWSRSSNK